MRLGIMQPYLFPYIGYFQLIQAVDTFVVHDDVQFIKGGWINRNRILVNGSAHYFTLPLQKDAATLPIHQRWFTDGWQQNKAAMLRQLEGAYRKAPHYRAVAELVARCFESEERNVARFVAGTLRSVLEYLEISTPVLISSEVAKQNDLCAQERVIEINRVLGAKEYINPMGGVELYDQESFAQNGMVLYFLHPRAMEYRQFGQPFIPWLSILDVLMFNSKQAVQELLAQYDLVRG